MGVFGDRASRNTFFQAASLIVNMFPKSKTLMYTRYMFYIHLVFAIVRPF